MDEVEARQVELERLVRDVRQEEASLLSISPRDRLGRFVKGSPGRKRGSRNRLTHRLAISLLDDFHCHEEENIDRLRRWFFPEYMRLMARFLPLERGRSRPDFGDYTPAERAKVAAATRAALDRFDAGAGSLDEVLSALEQDPTPDAVTAVREACFDISKSTNYGESVEAGGGGEGG